MSNSVLTTVLEHSRAVNGARLTLIVLADRADNDGYCRPGYKYLLLRTRLNRTTLTLTLERLEKLGELFIQRSPRGNQYVILLHKTDAEIGAVLAARLNMGPADLETLLTTLHERHAAPLRTQRRGHNFKAEQSNNQTTVLKPEQSNNQTTGADDQQSNNQTPVVYLLDSCSLVTRPDPILSHSIPSNIDAKASSETPEKSAIENGPAPEVAPVQPHIAIIDAYWAGLPGGKPIRADYPRHVKVATAIRDAGYQAAQITRFMKAIYDPKTEVWEYKKWHHQAIPLEQVADLLPVWINHQPKPPPPVVFPADWHENRYKRIYEAYQTPEMKAAVENELRNAGLLK